MNRFVFYVFMYLFSSIALADGMAQQHDTFASTCEKYLFPPYISDGQNYFFELDKKDKGELKTTFFGGTTYRIITCGNSMSEKVIFTVYDTEKNLLFSNKNHHYTPYWDLKFTSTIDCIIEVTFLNKPAPPAKIKLLIAFKNE